MPPEFSGPWIGDAIQNNSIEFDILLTLPGGDTGTVVGIVTYPSLNCGGTLTLESQTEDSITLHENITFGIPFCIDQGTVVLTSRPPGGLDYAWTRNAVNATGSLHKVLTGDNELPTSFLGTWDGSALQSTLSFTILLALSGGDVGSIVGIAK
jgi:hypothetical protein